MNDRLIQIAMVLLIAVAVFVGSRLDAPIQARRTELNLRNMAVEDGMVRDPKAALLEVAPGGLRAPFLSYLWIRSQDLKDKGRLYDAKQVRDLICQLMPRFPGAWAYHAWDMAWNISATTYTEQERWMWVENGIELLRDKGLLYNPDSIIIYYQLAWIFENKIGNSLDDMHMAYKRRLAEQFDQVLGAGAAPDATTEEVIASFEPIARAPKTVEELRRDASVAACLDALAALQVPLDQDYLTFYNRFSDDPLAGGFTPVRDKPRSPQEEALAKLIKAPASAAAQAKVLAFVRAHVLRSRFHMDPEWMFQCMQKYGPLDWRSCHSQAIYWASLGLEKNKNLDLKDINPVNDSRTVLSALKTLMAQGQLYVYPDLTDPTQVVMDWGQDWRFIEPVNREYFAAGTILGKGDVRGEDNVLLNAHTIFLSQAVCVLYFSGKENLAQHYLDVIRDQLKPKGKIYDRDLPDFVRDKINELGIPMADMARCFWLGSMSRVYKALAEGNTADFTRYRQFSQRIYKIFTDSNGKGRLAVPPYEVQEGNFLVMLMLRPQAVGTQLTLLGKSRIYNGLPPEEQQWIYPYVAPSLEQECEAQGLNFAIAFPCPPGEVRKQAVTPVEKAATQKAENHDHSEK